MRSRILQALAFAAAPGCNAGTAHFHFDALRQRAQMLVAAPFQSATNTVPKELSYDD